ncbi:MAG: hypothetical protein LBO69_08565 [Ignavibacteria bacterium]|jgi:hypothetical protein|nr:hypothetical protein [Ignavibacteria bacterium]
MNHKFITPLAIKMMIAVSIIVLTSNVATAFDCTDCPPLPSCAQWDTCVKDAKIYFIGNNCYLTYSYCAYIDTGFAMHIYIPEIAGSYNDCVDTLDLQYNYKYYFDKCIEDVLSQIDTSESGRFIIPPCYWGKNYIVHCGHPSCMTEPYTVEIHPELGPWVDTNVGTGELIIDPSETTPMPITTTITTTTENENANTGELNYEQTDGAEEFGDIPIGNQWDSVTTWETRISPCGTIEPEDICWQKKYYCWVPDESAPGPDHHRTIIEDGPIEQIGRSSCPPEGGRMVFTKRDGGFGGGTYAPVWVECHYMCIQGNN